MNIVIAAGGTGGHLYPAVALAKEFRQQDPSTVITFVGAGRNLEKDILAHEGFQVTHITVAGIVGRGSWKALQGLLLLPNAIWKSIRLLRASRADLVIGTGGYFSPPVVLAAWFLRIGRVILEPNAIPGLANRVLGPVANRVFLAFESGRTYFNSSKTRIVGTPVRKEFFNSDSSPAVGKRKTLLVFGGSQGARTINSALVEALRSSRVMREDLYIIHQTGTEDHERTRLAYREAGVEAEVVPFLFKMPEVLKSADLVVSRSGAGTLAEVAVCGKPAILIPFPHSTHGHQEMNARAAETAGAARVMLESELNGRSLAREIEELMNNSEKLKTMAEKSLVLGVPDSTARMVRECQLLLATR